MKTARSLSIAVGVLTLAALIAGCATSPGTAPTHASSKISADAAPRAAWLDSSSFVVATRGDGCPPIIGDLVAADQRIDVRLTTASDEGCDGDPATYGAFVGVPAGIDTSKPVTIAVTQLGDEASLLELPGRADGGIVPADRMPSQLPAAAWIDEGELAVLTWGSSTCVPAGGAIDGDVLTLDEPTEGMCTMDFVPRITFVTADLIAADATLVLAGHTDAEGQQVVLRPTPRT